jgi:LytS/YehU family sensor histidine kinase
MLNDNQRDLIPMSRELDYLGNYIALQKLRTQQLQGILIEDNLAGQQCSQQIAPMLLIPSVENAFKHGISLREPSWIKIRLDCTTNAIHFEVRNSIHPALANDPEKDKSGIGLENVKERLLHQYPGQHEFVYGVTGNEFVVTLTIQTR